MFSLRPIQEKLIDGNSIEVMLQCNSTAWRSAPSIGRMSSLTNTNSIPERFGDALRHAGVGITVTSLTDVIAFAVGASTVISNL